MKEVKAVISENDNAQKGMVIYLKSHSRLKAEKQNLCLSTPMLMFFKHTMQHLMLWILVSNFRL